MVSEGRLLDEELLFHLRFNELERLVVERDPVLVARARQRQRYHAKKDALKFNELVYGPNPQPRGVRSYQKLN